MGDDLNLDGEIGIYPQIRVSLYVTGTFSFFHKCDEFVHCPNAVGVELFCIGDSWLTNFITDEMVSM